MHTEPDAGWLITIDLLLNSPTLQKLWQDELEEGGVLNLPYPFIALVAKKLEGNEFDLRETEQIITIINNAYDPQLEGDEGINNFLNAGFIEGLTSTTPQEILGLLRPELQKSYKNFYK